MKNLKKKNNPQNPDSDPNTDENGKMLNSDPDPH